MWALVDKDDNFLFGNLCKWIILVVFGIFTFVVGCQSYETVPPGHRGVRVTLGKVSPGFIQEGLVLKWPFIQDVVKLSIRQETKEATAECFSSDLQTVKIKYNCLFRIPEAQVVSLFQQYAGDVFESLINPRVQECMKTTTAKFRAEELVKNREAIKIAVMEHISKQIGTLLMIADLTITNIDLTDELEHAIEQKVKMEQLALAKKYELQKEITEAEITVVKAKADAESVRVRGEALKISPQVIELEVIKKWDGKAPTTLVTSGGGASIVLPVGMVK